MNGEETAVLWKTQAVSGGIRGIFRPPSDKSMSHRSLIFGALSRGKTVVKDLLQSGDVLATATILQQMGVSIVASKSETLWEIEGVGRHGLQAPSSLLDCGNSGTTARLMSGVLAAQDFTSILSGDASLRRRPMGRVMKPLAQMGAQMGNRDRALTSCDTS